MTPREKAELELTEIIPSADNEPDHAGLMDYLLILVKWKSMIIKIVGLATISMLLICLSMPQEYTATTKVMPPQQSQSMGALTALSQLGPLAALAGSSLGLRNPNDVYVAMLKSRAVADPLIDRFGLQWNYKKGDYKDYKKRFRVDAERQLAGMTEIKAEKEGIITISVTNIDPELASEIANAYVAQLRTLTQTLAVTEAQKRRQFFEAEVKNASDDLTKAEVVLKQTELETGMIVADSQSKAMLQALATIRAQITVKEVQLQQMRSFAAPDNPDLVRTEQELAALREQDNKLTFGGHDKQGLGEIPIEQIPSAGLKYLRAYRDVKYQETLFELLAKQYEAAKLDEARDALMVQQLERAEPPERKSAPHRGIIMLATMFLAFLGAVLLAYMREAFGKMKEDANFQTQLQAVRYYLHQKIKL